MYMHFILKNSISENLPHRNTSSDRTKKCARMFAAVLFVTLAKSW